MFVVFGWRRVWHVSRLGPPCGAAPPGDRGAALCGLPCGSVTKQLRHGPSSPPRSRGTTCLPSVLGSLPRCLAGISAHLSALGRGGREARPRHCASQRRDACPDAGGKEMRRRSDGSAEPRSLRALGSILSARPPRASFMHSFLLPQARFFRWFLSHSMHLVMSPALHAEETGRGASLFVSVVTFCGAVVPR